MMKSLKKFIALGLVAGFMAAPFGAFAADNNGKKKEAKAYPLDTCLVSDEKLGEMGDPYVFVHKGQEVKLCCKSCQKDFKKNTAKYMKKIDKAEKKKSQKS